MGLDTVEFLLHAGNEFAIKITDEDAWKNMYRWSVLRALL